MSEKIKLNLGCGIRIVKGFINVDNYLDEEKLKAKSDDYISTEWQEGAVFMRGDMRKLPFSDNYADYIECADAIEHISHRDIGRVFGEFYRVLKPGGNIVLATVDFDELARLWVDCSKGSLGVPFLDSYVDLFQIIYGSQKHEGEFHRMPFNSAILFNLLLASGFEKDKMEMRVYPTGSTDLPPFETYPSFEEGTVNLTQMLWVSAYK